MGKRDKLKTVFCRQCGGVIHPEGEHLAKPKIIIHKPTDTVAMSQVGDGASFTSTAHPRRPGRKPPADISPAAIETVEAPPALADELERLGPEGVAKRKADRRKRTKAETQALVDAEIERKRALKTARQARWRANQKKAKKRKKAKK